MTEPREPGLSADVLTRIRALREDEERHFISHAFDYLRENAIVGDVHEYGCDRRPLLPLAIDVAKTCKVAGMRFFGFAPFEQPRTVPGRGPRTESAFHDFVPLAKLQDAVGGAATLAAGATAKILSRGERDRFMNTQNKVALAIIHAPTGSEATMALEFAEPLLTEGSLVYFADLHAGYRRTAAKDVGRAFLEFQARCRFRYLRHMDIGWWGRSYMACLPVDLPFERL